MGLHPVEFSTLPFLFHLHATWSSGSWALILTNYHCMVSRKFRSRSWTFFASAPPTLWPGSQLLSNGGDLQGLLHPEFSVSKLCVLTGFILTAFHHLPGYYLLLWFLSLRRNFSLLNPSGGAHGVSTGSPVSGIGVREDGCFLLQLTL